MKEFMAVGVGEPRKLTPFTSSRDGKVEEASKGFTGCKSCEHESNMKRSSDVSALNFPTGADGYLVNSPNNNPKGRM